MELLREQLDYFDDNAPSLLSSQLRSFHQIQQVFQGNHDHLSRQRRSELSRAVNFLSDILSILGPEVFLLCSFALPITTLCTIRPQRCIPKLQDWWRSAPRPRGLTVIAAELCTPISELTRPDRKRKFSKIGIEGDLDTYNTPYCTSLSTRDLISFLEKNSGRYNAFTLRVPEDISMLPCIEIPNDVCQELIMHANAVQVGSIGSINSTVGLP